MKKIHFRSLDRSAEIKISERNLPHWFQTGAAIFVTFRTVDSMPAEVIRNWQRELEEWLSARDLPVGLALSVTGQQVDNHDLLLSRLEDAQKREFKRLSDRIFHRALDDCHGKCLLRQPQLARIVGDAIRFYDNDRYDLDRFVVMPNHVHTIVQFRTGASLATISESWMRYTARQINKSVGASGAFWQPEPFDHIIRSPEQFDYLQRYIQENPQKANLADKEVLYWQRPL